MKDTRAGIVIRHSKITASQIQTKDGVRQSLTFVTGHCVRHTATRIHHEARRPSLSVQRQDSLGRHARGGQVENLENDLRHALSVSIGSVGKTGSSSGASLSSLKNVWCQMSSMSFKFVTKTTMPSICIPPWAGGSAAIGVGARDPGSHPLGFAPRSPRHARSNTHLSKKPFCLHGESSQLIWDTSKISSDCLTINFSDMSNICFKVRSFSVILMECKISE